MPEIARFYGIVIKIFSATTLRRISMPCMVSTWP